MSRRSVHLAEMRVALAEGCSLPEAKRKLAALRHRAVELARQAQGRRVGFASLDGRLSASLDPARDERSGFGSSVLRQAQDERNMSGGALNFWWVDHD